MATIKDIAKQAGVSPMTVSNVINGKSSKVSKATRDKINKIIEENNYVPNMSARTLVNNTSRIIGIILPNYSSKEAKELDNPFNTTLLNGVESEVRKSNYYLMIRSVESHKEIDRLLKNWRVDGVILLGLSNQELLEVKKECKIPLMFVDSYVGEESIRNVGLEDEEGGYLAAKHLLQHGHTKLGFIAYNTEGTGVLGKRLKGFRKAVKEYGLNDESINVVEIEGNNLENNKKLQDKVLDVANKATAIFCTADILAITVMEFLKTKGYDFPKDLSIIGFDDLYISSLVTPKLTTIKQDIYEKGILAARYLIEEIEGKVSVDQQIRLPVELIERESVRQLNPLEKAPKHSD